ncbi:MAG: heavy-metal-associated domain-containing protein [Candidatus Methylomirabilales bacterium]
MMEDQANCHVDPLLKTVDPEALTQSETAVLQVTGMGCQTCAMRVRNSLLSRPGVVQAQIDLFSALALVHYDAEQIEPQGLMEAVAAAGSDGRHVYRASVLS